MGCCHAAVAKEGPYQGGDPSRALKLKWALGREGPGQHCSRERSKGEGVEEPGWKGSTAREQRSLAGVGGHAGSTMWGREASGGIHHRGLESQRTASQGKSEDLIRPI